MSQPNLERECRLFTRYLIDREPDPGAIAGYVSCHRSLDRHPQSRSLIDRVILSVGRSGRLGLRLADAYGRFFRPDTLLRQKLVLALAVLENSPGTHEALQPGPRGTVRILREAAGAAFASLWWFGWGMLLFAPFHLVSALTRNRNV